MDHCGSLWIVVGRCGVVVGSLWVVVGRCGSVWVVPCFSNYVYQIYLAATSCFIFAIFPRVQS